MAGRYYFEGSEDDFIALYLYYPEITISNSIGEKHTMKDMVVRLYLNPTGVEPDMQGKRFSYTKKELRCRYTHSHLDQGLEESDDFGHFCLGGDSTLRKYLAKIQTSCTLDQFELLLVQIEQYLAWESIEGKPYISISRLFTAETVSTPSYLDSNLTDKVAREFIEHLTPEHLFQVNEYQYILNSGLNGDKVFQLEKDVIDRLFRENVIKLAQLYDYDVETRTYLGAPADTGRSSLPPALSSSLTKPVRDAFKITPSIYELEAPTQRTSVIKRLGTNDLNKIFVLINEYLTYSHKLNGQDDIIAKGEDINNTKTTITDNSTTQPVSTEQGMVGTLAI